MWSSLFLLLGVALTLLVVLTVRHEDSRVHDQLDAAATDAAAEARSELLRTQQSLQALQALAAHASAPQRWLADAAVLLRQNPELLRIERRAADCQISTAADSPQAPPLFSVIRRDDIDIDTVAACAAPVFSRSYFVPQADSGGVEVMDLCLPVRHGGRDAGYQLVAAVLGLSLRLFALALLLADELHEALAPPYWPHELADGYRQRQNVRLAAGTGGPDTSREGFETRSCAKMASASRS